MLDAELAGPYLEQPLDVVGLDLKVTRNVK